ncbi:MAG: hypothetical protein HYZ11_18870 [Candidatus Tectomicrobia bacterium]|uniref:Uncharacterized protein n=1 Tax=Tectimicrobiota bacterium TaxID=2528274 RepID=A0A932I1K0_UNCTE|nr:hypothetical protein [Candidatus Tectomicrobia bacterium]
MRETPPISAPAMDAILRFLPLFESADFQSGRWVLKKPGGGGALTFPYYEYGRDVGEFLGALNDNGWIIPFDWLAWQEEAAKYVDSPALLETADAGTLRRLLTTHARMERFCDGHLADMLGRGHIAAVLGRLARLREDAL